MVQQIRHSFSRNVLSMAKMRCQNVSKQMRCDTNRFACSCRERQAMKQKAQKNSYVGGSKPTEPSFIRGFPLKQIWLWIQVLFFRALARLHDGGLPSMSSLKQLPDLHEKPTSHVADEEKLPLIFLR